MPGRTFDREVSTLKTADTPIPPAPSADELLARAQALVPAIGERAPQGERDRRVPPETIEAMRAAGLFRALQPRRRGGSEVHLARFYEIQMTLAAGDMSTAWIYGVLGVTPFLVALLDDRAAADVWENDPSALIGLSLAPSGTATPEDGGFRLRGRWRYASGSTYADWLVLGTLTRSAPDAPPEWRACLVPKSEVQLVDTWHTSGLRGTGSHDVVVEGTVVPDYRTRRMADNVACVGPGQTVNTGPLYRVPFGQVFGGGVAYGAIGALQGMLDAFSSFAAGRVRLHGRVVADDADAREIVAEVEYAIEDMKALAARNATTLMSYAERGEVPPTELRLKFKFHLSTVAERCRELAARLFIATGTSGILAQYPFGRILNDITAGRQHITNQRETYAREWGGALLDRPFDEDLMQ